MISLPHGYYEELSREKSAVMERMGNIDVIKAENLSICHLLNFLGFSRASATDCSNQKQAAKTYKDLAATLLAIQHFNTGNGVIVKEIEGIQDRCPVRLTAEFHDSQYTPNEVVQTLTNRLANSSSTQPCAVIGARTSSSTGPSAIVSGVYDLPQMSFTATSPELNDRFKYHHFTRIVPADDAAAKAAIRFLNHLQSTHLAVVFVNDPFGNSYIQAIQRPANNYNIALNTFPVAFPPDPKDIRSQLQKVKETGIRHVLMVFFSDYIEPVMTQATQLEIVGPDYFWFLGISTSFFQGLELEAGSELATAIRGMGILPEFGAKPDSDGYHHFVNAWDALGQEDVAYFNSKIPTILGNESCYQAPVDFFQEMDPGSTAHFAYDTVLAMGLGACAAMAANDKVGDESAGFDGVQHTQAIIDTVFEGATGIVSLKEETGSRDPLRFQYAVLNVQPRLDTATQMVTFDTPETDVLIPNEQLTDWNLVSKQPFLFQDGTSIPPPSLPDITVEMNYIGYLAIFGLVACALVVGLSLGFAIWTYLHRQMRVVRASQPFFLGMVCTGTLLLGTVIVPLSVDDQHFSPEGADVACKSIPWLASMGFVTMFSALASKTWRINRLHRNAKRFSRLKLTTMDVLVPFLLLSAANVTVLLCWTIMAPLQFVRMPDSGTDKWNRLVSSTGRCLHDESNLGSSIPYMIALAVVNLSAVLFANAQAYMARNIHTSYSEARYIGLIMIVLLQCWLTGIPVIGLVYDDPRANYVVSVLIVFLTSMATLLLIFVPKIMYLKKQQMANTIRIQSSKGLSLNNRCSSEDIGAAELDGLKVFRAANGSFRGSQITMRQSYASVDALKQYLEKSNSNRRLENGSSSFDHDLGTNSIQSPNGEFSRSIKAANDEPMARLSEETVKDENQV